MRRIRVRENAYRDVWLFVLTVMLLVAAKWAVDASGQARNATVAIQGQRVATIWTSCQEQNRRHDATVRELYIIIAKAERRASPQRRTAIQTAQVTTTLLIDQLAPRQNCVAVVRKATSSRVSLPPLGGNYPPVFPSHKRSSS